MAKSAGKKTVKSSTARKPVAKKKVASAAKRTSRPVARRSKSHEEMRPHPLGFGVTVFVTILLLFVLIAISVALGRMSAGE
ncbi:hypothetical protein FWH09_02355 [Candidatus Saccharibacteria bacterium]|nr:hypothetical protein [Candidatus Saccharibacteria bacterium]